MEGIDATQDTGDATHSPYASTQRENLTNVLRWNFGEGVRNPMYAFIVGFNEWVLKGWVAGQGWKRSKSKDASGWEHDGQIIRELKAPEALAGMSGRNCKLIVVKPEKRGGYMPSQVMTSALKEAKRRGIQIDERIQAP